MRCCKINQLSTLLTPISLGNTFYKSGDHTTATVKYRKCCKYITLLRDTVGSTDDEEEKRSDIFIKFRC